jgi:transcriptional regulator NrdR family protein
VRCSCGGDTRVVDSRIIGASLRRRRLCMECGKRFSTLETVLVEEPKQPKPVKEKIPYVAKEVAEKIKQKKLHARRAVEDMLIAREEADIFDDSNDEDIQWTSSL